MAINGAQRKVLAAVRSIEVAGEAATVERIATEIGFSDTGSIDVWLGRLVYDNYLTHDTASDGFSITDAGLVALADQS